MQYIYTQEEHDRFATDQAAFALKVKLEADKQIRVRRAAATKVIQAFANEFRAELGRPYSYGQDDSLFKRLVQLSDDISAAIDSCDKPTSGVIQST